MSANTALSWASPHLTTPTTSPAPPLPLFPAWNPPPRIITGPTVYGPQQESCCAGAITEEAWAELLHENEFDCDTSLTPFIYFICLSFAILR